MTAPEPMFSARGTPIAIINRCRALTALGHQVDLVTYPMGEDVDIVGLRVVRVANVLRRSHVAVGPSAAKVPYDSVMLLKTAQLLRTGRYDVIHTNEETGAFGWWLARRFGVKHLRDLHSNLAVVLTNYGFAPQHPLTRFAGWLERRTIMSASAVIAVYPQLLELCRSVDPAKPVHVVHNIPLDLPPQPDHITALRDRWSADGSPVIVYAGTLEPYQGMASVVEALALVGVLPDGRQPRLVVAGGTPVQIAELEALAARLGVAGQLLTLGKRPFTEIPSHLAAADVLVSPRTMGTNTPLKIYSYICSGRPIVASNIESHTQILDDDTAILVPPTPAGMAAGLSVALTDGSRVGSLIAATAQLAAREYSPRAYLASVAAAYAELGAPLPTANEIDALVPRLLQAATVEPVPVTPGRRTP